MQKEYEIEKVKNNPNTNETEYNEITEKQFIDFRNGFTKAIEDLVSAFKNVNQFIFTPLNDNGNIYIDVNDFIINKYPFDFSLDEMDGAVEEWLESIKKELKEKYEAHKNEFKKA